MGTPKVYSRFNPPPSVGVDCGSKNMTQQEYKDSCDINTMIRRALGGDLTVLRHPCYVDVVGAPESAHDVANRIAKANTVWADLPDNIRASFGSPENLLKHIDDNLKVPETTKVVSDTSKSSKSVSTETVSVQSETPTPKST